MSVPVEILERACRQDDEAFDMLYEHYKLPVGNYLLSFVRNREDADDLYQETFIRVWRHLSQPDATVPPYFDRWIYTVAKNLAFDRHRRRKLVDFFPLPEDVEGGEWAGMQAEGPEEQFFSKFCLQEALVMMSPKYRKCLVLHYGYGFSQQEIAERLNVGKSSVDSNLFRARIQFREYYTQVLRVLYQGEVSHDQQSTGNSLRWQSSRVRVEIYSRGGCLAVCITYRRFYRVVPALLPVLRPNPYLQKEVI